MRFLLAVVSSLVVLPIGTARAEDVIKGVYLGSPELCAQAKKDTLQTVIEADNAVLTNAGIEAIEFNCPFLQYLKNPRMPSGWTVISMCEEPGYAYPEMFSVVERQAGQLEVAALTEMNGAAMEAESAPEGDEPAATAPPPPPGGANTDDAPPPAADGETADDGEAETVGLSGTYYRCEGVSVP